MSEIIEVQEETAQTDDIEQEKLEVHRYVEELSGRIASKATLRNENLNCQRIPESHFSKLDSSLKKNTAYVKKLKQFTTAQLDGLIKEMNSLNLTKYTSEVSTSITEAKIKMTDIQAMLILSSKLHQTYADFAQHFFESWQKVLMVKPGEKVANPSKMRVDLRLYCELISIGIFSNKIGLPLLGSVLTNLIAQDKEEHGNLSIILSFCKHCGEEYAGLNSRHIIVLAKKYEIPIPSSSLLPGDKQQNVRNLLRDYHQRICRCLKVEHKELQSAERAKRKMMESKGEISNEKRDQLEMIQNNFEKLYSSTQTLSDLLNENMPDLPREVEAAVEGNVLEMEESGDLELDPWGDEDTKSFYVDLPDLRQFLPNYFAPKETSPTQEEVQLTEEALDAETAEPELDVEEQAIAADIELIQEEEKVKEAEEELAATEVFEADVGETNSVPEKATSNVLSKQYCENFMANLQNCVNKELIDGAAIVFLLNLNTKNNRKKIVKTLFNVHRTRLDLLPLYARFSAVINLVARDVSTELAQMLKVDFKYHVKKRDQINIESKIKVVRYIGELVKFGIYSKIEALFCLKYLLHNFQHHHIEMTCAFLEVCGQYLYNSKESRLRTNVYLENMMRLKTATALDSRHAAQIENSYYLVKPPEGMRGIQIKIRPPMHLYIRHLIYEELSKNNVDRIVKYLRRLNWDDPEISNYTIRCLSRAYLLRYHIIRCLADVVSALSSYQEKAVTKVIDNVYEDIRAGLEIHSFKLAQRRVSMARFLGELYIYRLIDSSNVLNTLYSIISLGVTFNHETPSSVDPPDSLFRLKLALVLLDTCGSYFQSSASKKKLDYYLVFLQHYYWFKKSHPMYTEKDSTASNNNDLFPILIDHMYKETLHNLRPKLKLIKSFETAKEEIENLRKQLYPNLNDTGASVDSTKLNTIDENETEEYTSEAVGESDDEMKPRSEREDDDPNDDYNEEDENRESPTDASKSQDDKEPEKTQDDLEFELAFEKMATDSYQERIKESFKVNPKDIPVPTKYTGKNTKKTYEQLQDEPQETDSVPFVLMLRSSKGGKQQFKTFAAPSDSPLAVNLKLQEQKTKEENERVKRLTLNITERIEEEDYQESLLQSKTPTVSRIKQKLPKFKHQKGVPDTDSIFH